jgi:hypothetical protein
VFDPAFYLVFYRCLAVSDPAFYLVFYRCLAVSAMGLYLLNWTVSVMMAVTAPMSFALEPNAVTNWSA